MSNEQIILKEEKNEMVKSALPRQRRIIMYKEMRYIEPRMWTKEHHWIRMASIVFGMNFTIYGLWNFYYKFYVPSIGFFDSVMRSNKAKILLSSIVFLNVGVYYLNTYLLHERVYREFYEKLTDEEFFEMYRSLLSKSKNKIKI